jgi:hypothetical protein
MATTNDTWIDQARRKMAKRMAHMTLWKLRDMRRRLTRPRTLRLPKQARALKSLLREAQAPGLLPTQPAQERARNVTASTRRRPGEGLRRCSVRG